MGAGEARRRLGVRRGRVLTAAGLLLVTAPLLVYAAYLPASRPALYDHGDQVLLELNVLRATRFDQLLGAYSQFGFAHPGPTWFYLMSPFYRLLGADTPAAVAAAAIVEAGFGAAVVALAARWRGGRAALPTALIVLLYLRAIAVPAVTYLWNPFAVMPATILFVLLAAAAAAGRGRAGWGVAIVGSFLIQTDVSTVPLVGCVALLLLVPIARVKVLSRRLDTSSGMRRTARPRLPSHPRLPSRFTLVALVILVGEWIPPLLQQFTQSPGNLTQLASTLLGAGTTFHSPWAALAAETQAVSVFPFGSLALFAAAAHPTFGGTLELLAWIAGAWALHRSGTRHVDRLAVSLGAISLWAAGISFAAACIVRGGMNAYQFYWVTGLPVVTLLGWVLHLSARPQAVSVPRTSGPGRISRSLRQLLPLRQLRPLRLFPPLCLRRIPRLRTAVGAAGVAAALLAPAVAQNLIGFTARSAQHNRSADTPLTTADRLVDGYLAGRSPQAGQRGVLLLDQDTRDKDATVVLELVRNLYQRGWHPIVPPRLAAHDELRNPHDQVGCTILIAADRDEVPPGAKVLGPLRAGPHAPVAAVLAG